MKKYIFYCVAAFAMVLMIAGQASAACDVDFDGEKLEIKCNNALDAIEVFVGDAGNLRVDTSSGLENLGSAEFLKDIVIESEGGADEVLIHSLEVTDSIEVKSGRGSDDVEISNVTVGNDLKIETDRGRDDVTLWNVTAENSIDVKTGRGRDIVTASGNTTDPDVTTGNDAKFDGGRGRDTFNGIDEVSAGNEVEIKGFKFVNP